MDRFQWSALRNYHAVFSYCRGHSYPNSFFAAHGDSPGCRPPLLIWFLQQSTGIIRTDPFLRYPNNTSLNTIKPYQFRLFIIFLNLPKQRFTTQIKKPRKACIPRGFYVFLIDYSLILSTIMPPVLQMLQGGITPRTQETG